MIKLCWKKDKQRNTQEYYFDEKTRMLYQICLADYYAGAKIKMTPATACMIGPLVTLSGIWFDDKHMGINSIVLISSMVFLLIGILLINRGYDSSEAQKYLFVEKNSNGIPASDPEIYNLFRDGRKQRCGIKVLIALGAFLTWFSTIMYKSDKNITSILFFYMSIFITVISIKMLAPLKNHLLLKNIKKERKRKL